MSKADRIAAIQSVIQSLQAWVAYVDTLNECAYSDRMLEDAVEKLQEISEEPFKKEE